MECADSVAGFRRNLGLRPFFLPLRPKRKVPWVSEADFCAPDPKERHVQQGLSLLDGKTHKSVRVSRNAPTRSEDFAEIWVSGLFFALPDPNGKCLGSQKTIFALQTQMKVMCNRNCLYQTEKYKKCPRIKECADPNPRFRRFLGLRSRSSPSQTQTKSASQISALHFDQTLHRNTFAYV